MDWLADPTLLRRLLVILQVIWIDAVLSIDNAAALAVLAEPLPTDKPAPWPLGWLGSQQQSALKAGMWMAFIFRGILLALAVYILTGPAHLIGSVIGALWLFALVIKHFFPQFPLRLPEVNANLSTVSQYWIAIGWIEVTDLTFSFDNVSAIAALSTEWITLMIGIVISVPMIRFAATKMIPLMGRMPSLEHAAYVLIGIIGVELLITRISTNRIDEIVQFFISISVVVMAVIYHYISTRRRVFI